MDDTIPFPDLSAGEPILAWRANKVIFDLRYHSAWLLGVHYRELYGTHAVARCNALRHHEPPGLSCTCGLHAWPAATDAERYRGRWGQDAVCHVELSGEIAVHGDRTGVEGFRSSHMTTLGVWFDPHCWRCRDRACGLTPVRPFTGRFTGRWRRPREYAELRPSCDRCASTGLFTCADIAGMLGTEVAFSKYEYQSRSQARRGAAVRPGRGITWRIGGRHR